MKSFSSHTLELYDRKIIPFKLLVPDLGMRSDFDDSQSPINV